MPYFRQRSLVFAPASASFNTLRSPDKRFWVSAWGKNLTGRRVIAYKTTMQRMLLRCALRVRSLRGRPRVELSLAIRVADHTHLEGDACRRVSASY